MRSYLLSAVLVVLIVSGLSRSAAAVKRVALMHGSSCQPKKTNGTLPSLSYSNAGVMVESTTADLICPLTWSKDVLTTWATLDKVDIQVDWLGLPSTTPVTTTPTWGCTLVYESAGGALYMANLPVTYPMPPFLDSVAYAALWCTVPQSMGIQGYSINMCFVSAAYPLACAPP